MGWEFARLFSLLVLRLSPFSLRFSFLFVLFFFVHGSQGIVYTSLVTASHSEAKGRTKAKAKADEMDTGTLLPEYPSKRNR